MVYFQRFVNITNANILGAMLIFFSKSLDYKQFDGSRIFNASSRNAMFSLSFHTC